MSLTVDVLATLGECWVPLLSSTGGSVVSALGVVSAGVEVETGVEADDFEGACS